MTDGDSKFETPHTSDHSGRTRRFFSYSISGHEDDARIAWMLKVIGMGNVFFGSIYLLTFLLLSMGGSQYRVLLHAMYLILTGAVMLIRVRNKYIHGTSMLFCISFFLFFMFDSWSDQGLSDISYLCGSLLVICVTSILLGLHAGVISALLAALNGLALGYSEQMHWMVPRAAPPPIERWVNAIFFFGGFLVFIYLADRALRTSLASARHEVEERKRTEDALREREEQLRIALEAARMATWEWNIPANVVRWSDAAAEVFGVPQSSLGARHEDYINLVHRDDRPLVQNAIDFALKHNTSEYSVEHRVNLANGTQWIECKGRVIRGLENQPLFLRGVMTDITARKINESERRQMEERMRQSQRMEALGKLAGGVAHDFNNILTGILGHGDIARMELSAHPALVHVNEITNAALRAGSLTKQLLALSRKQVLEPRVLNVNAVVADLQKLLERLIGSHITLKSEFQANAYCVKADRGQLEQVILNLVVNARDAMPDGGTIVIRTRNMASGDCMHQWGSLDGAERVLAISVSDSGVGMDESVKTHLFEPYFTTKTEGRGTGLGLSTVYGIVEQSKGAIGLETGLGKGTTFHIYLRGTTEMPSAIMPTVPDMKGAQAGETVLVAEDNKMIADVLRNGLGLCGYQVTVLSNGEEALQWARDHHGPLHLLLTDVIMPGKSGFHLANEVRHLHPGIKVLFMSGYTANEMNHHPNDTQNLQFIEKPFTLDKLLNKVRQVLDAEA